MKKIDKLTICEVIEIARVFKYNKALIERLITQPYYSWIPQKRVNDVNKVIQKLDKIQTKYKIELSYKLFNTSYEDCINYIFYDIPNIEVIDNFIDKIVKTRQMIVVPGADINQKTKNKNIIMDDILKVGFTFKFITDYIIHLYCNTAIVKLPKVLNTSLDEINKNLGSIKCELEDDIFKIMSNENQKCVNNALNIFYGSRDRNLYKIAIEIFKADFKNKKNIK